MIQRLYSPLPGLQKSMLLVTVGLAFITAYIYVPYRVPGDGGVRFGWSWSPVEYSDPLMNNFLSGLDVDKLEKAIPYIDKERFLRSHIHTAKRSPFYALCIPCSIAIVGFTSVMLLNFRKSTADTNAVPTKVNWRKSVIIGMVPATLFVLSFAPYEKDENNWSGDDFSVTATRVQIGLPFRWLRFTALQVDGAPSAYGTLPGYEEYGRGLRVDLADLALDIGFVVAIGVLIYAASGRLLGKTIQTLPQRIGLRLAVVCGTAVVAGAAIVPILGVERRAMGFGVLVIPLVINATFFFTARSYFTMLIGTAVSVVGLWYGTRATLIAAQAPPIAAFEIEELRVMGFLFVAYVGLQLPVVLASRIFERE